MKIHSIVILLAAASAQASIVNLSNFQSSADVSMNGYGTFNGFSFSTVTMGVGNYGGEIIAVLTLGDGGELSSNRVAQRISAQASVDFASPGYLVTRIYLGGWATDNGVAASESWGVTSPCTAAIWGSESYGSRICVPDGGIESGTITAWMHMSSDADNRTNTRDHGFITYPQIQLTLVPNPEPGTMLLIGGALIGLGLIRRKR
jgi:PEP-CTERM motif